MTRFGWRSEGDIVFLFYDFYDALVWPMFIVDVCSFVVHDREKYLIARAKKRLFGSSQSSPINT